jgi:hypothetical protein
MNTNESLQIYENLTSNYIYKDKFEYAHFRSPLLTSSNPAAIVVFVDAGL